MSNFRNPKTLSSFDSTKNHASPYASYGVGPLGAFAGVNPFVDAPNKAYIDDFFQQELQANSSIHPSTLLSDTLTHFGFDQPSFAAIPLTDIYTTVQTLNLVDFLYAMYEIVNISNDGGWFNPNQNQELRNILSNTQGTVGSCTNQFANVLQTLGISNTPTQVQPIIPIVPFIPKIPTTPTTPPTANRNASAGSNQAPTAINPIIAYIKTDLLKYNLANRPTVSMNDRDVLEKVVSRFGFDKPNIKSLKLAKNVLISNVVSQYSMTGYQAAQGLLAIVDYGVSSKQLDKATANALISKKYNVSNEGALATKSIGEIVADLRELLGWTSGSRLGLGLGLGVVGLASTFGYMKWKTGDFLGRTNPLDDEEADLDDEDVEDEDIDDEEYDESFDDSSESNEE